MIILSAKAILTIKHMIQEKYFKAIKKHVSNQITQRKYVFLKNKLLKQKVFYLMNSFAQYSNVLREKSKALEIYR
jgi:hypothetical protein